MSTLHYSFRKKWNNILGDRGREIALVNKFEANWILFLSKKISSFLGSLHGHCYDRHPVSYTLHVLLDAFYSIL